MIKSSLVFIITVSPLISFAGVSYLNAGGSSGEKSSVLMKPSDLATGSKMNPSNVIAIPQNPAKTTSAVGAYDQVKFLQKNQSDLIFSYRSPLMPNPITVAKRPEEFTGDSAVYLDALKQSHQTKDWVKVLVAQPIK